MIQSKAVRDRFIERTLDKYGDRMIQSIREGIIDNRYEGTGELLQSVRKQTNASDEYLSGVLSLAMAMHGRYNDINATHKYKLKTENPEKNRSHYKPKTKRTGFYTRNVMGNLNGIIYSILYGLTDEVVAGIKEELHQTKIEFM